MKMGQESCPRKLLWKDGKMERLQENIQGKATVHKEP